MALKLQRLKNAAQLIDWARDIIEKLNQFFTGHIFPERAKTVTVSGNLTATTVSDSMVASDSLILVMPASANAKAIGWYVDQALITDKSQFVLGHGTASLSITFQYTILN